MTIWKVLPCSFKGNWERYQSKLEFTLTRVFMGYLWVPCLRSTSIVLFSMLCICWTSIYLCLLQLTAIHCWTKDSPRGHQPSYLLQNLSCNRWLAVDGCGLLKTRSLVYIKSLQQFQDIFSVLRWLPPPLRAVWRCPYTWKLK